MTKSNPMNQFCCQKGKSDCSAFLDSLYTIRAAPGEEVPDGVEDDEEECFLRDRLCDPEEATVRNYPDRIASDRERERLRIVRVPRDLSL